MPHAPMSRRSCRRYAAAAALAAAATAASSAPLVVGVLTRADDERLEPRRLELAYLGQPGGALRAGVDLAVADSRFELDAAGLEPRIEAVEVRSADDARAQAARLAQAGAAALVTDLPAAWTLAAASTRLPVVNAGSAADALRERDCRANLFHTAPSQRMLADALAQWLVARRWSRVLLLAGPSGDDAARLAVVQASLRRYGLKAVAVRPFKLSADPRERDAANPLLLTGSTEYDVVWVVDSDGEFARGLPYRTALPRPVVGDAGLVALAWSARFERYGAPQLNRRFQRAQQRPMTGADWAAWQAGRAVLQAALAAPPARLAQTLQSADFALDGFKGVRLAFRPWDRQLRQPVLLGDGHGVIALAPVDGVLHRTNVLDTLGADAPEKLCAAGAP